MTKAHKHAAKLAVAWLRSHHPSGTKVRIENLAPRLGVTYEDLRMAGASDSRLDKPRFGGWIGLAPPAEGGGNRPNGT